MQGGLAHIAEYQKSNKVSLYMFFNARMWGFAFLRAWTYIMFVGLNAPNFALTQTPLPVAVYQWSALSLCLTLFLGAIGYKKMRAVLFSKHVRWFATLLTPAGTFLGFLITALEGSTLLVTLFGGVFTGVGSGLLCLGYGEIYSKQTPDEVSVEVPLAALIAGIVYALSEAMSSLANVALVSLLPLASGIIMSLQSHTWHPHHTVKASTTVRPFFGFFLRVGLCTCIVGFADGVIRLIFMAVAHITPDDFYHPGMLFSSIVMAVLLIGFLFIWHQSTFRSFYKYITFTIAVSIALTPMFLAAPTWGSLLALTGYNTFNVLTWILLANISYNLKLPATFTFGLGWGFLTVGNTMGQVAGDFIAHTAALSLIDLSLASGLTILMILALFVFVLRDNDLVDIQKIPLTVSTDNKSESGTSSNENGETSGVDNPHPDSFQSACLKVARKKELTPRETEIMLLFARGRSSTYIQKELCISKGTVTTHLQHIYRKTDVHSKQELLDLIELNLPPSR